MRDMQEKKGGGLTILTKNKDIKMMKKIDTKQKDILIVEVDYGTDNLTLVLVCTYR